jgi:hypothetical protein
LDEERAAALAIFRQYLFDPGWREILQLALGFFSKLGDFYGFFTSKVRRL